MKGPQLRLDTLLMLFWMVVLITACQTKQKVESEVITKDGDTLVGPGAYNDYLVSRQEMIISGIVDLGNSFQSFDSTRIMGAYNHLNEQIDRSITQVQALKPYEGDTLLKPATLQLFRFYKDVSGNQYKAITSIILQGPHEITQSDLNTIDSLTQSIARSEAHVDSIFEIAQHKFARHYNMVILENEFKPASDTVSPK